MRILVVEDDRKVGAFLQKGLREEQFAVDVCADGEEALARARLNPYNLIILDVMLPKKDGFAVCRELRRSAILTPILMLTAKDSVEDKVLGLSEGTDEYLAKPFAFEELLARIRAFLRRTRDYQPSPFSLGRRRRPRWPVVEKKDRADVRTVRVRTWTACCRASFGILPGFPPSA